MYPLTYSILLQHSGDYASSPIKIQCTVNPTEIITDEECLVYMKWKSRPYNSRLEVDNAIFECSPKKERKSTTLEIETYPFYASSLLAGKLKKQQQTHKG